MGSRDQELVTLGRGRTTLHASARKSIAVWVRPRETVRQCFQKFDDLTLLRIRQTKITGGHIAIVRHLWRGPAVYFFGGSRLAKSGRDRVRIPGASIVEIDEPLHALKTSAWKEPLLQL